MTDSPMMQIGGVMKDTVEAAADAILKVSSCSADPKVVIKAFETLATLGETKHVTVQHCTFTNNPDESAIGVATTPAFVGSDYKFEHDRY